MKKLMNIFVLVAIVAMALVSCQKPGVDNVEPQEYEYTFLIGDADTKATVGENCVEWEVEDKVGTFNSKSNNEYSLVTAIEPATLSVSAPSDGNSAGLEENEVLHFYYPYASGDVEKTSVAMSIPTQQDGDDDMPMVSLPFTVTSATTEAQNEYAGVIKFANLGSVIEFNIYTDNVEYAEEIVKSVTFEADEALAGEFTFDLTQVDYSNEETLSIKSVLTETAVVANVSNDLVVGTKEEPAIVKMIVAPGTYAGNIVVKTNAATYTFPISNAKEFKRSTVKPLGLRLRADVRKENAAEEAYFEKVIATPADWSGNYLIVFEHVPVCWDGSLKCGTSSGQLGHTAGSKSVTIDNNRIKSNASYFIIAKSGDNYSITSAYGDCVGNLGTSAGLKSGSYTCSISLNNDKTVNIIASDGNTQVLYNKSANYIRFYKTTNVGGNNYGMPSLYRLVGDNTGADDGGEAPATPEELVMSEVTCSNQTENSLTFIWPAVQGATAYQVYFDSVDKGQITDLTYTASNLEAGTSYTIAVKAVGDGVNYSTSTSAKTCTASTTASQADGEETQKIVTFDYNGVSSNTEYTGETIDGVTLSGENVSTNKNGEFRVFANTGTFTLNAGNQKMTKIELTFSGNYKGTFTLDGYSDGIWNGNANAVTFKNTGSQARIKKIIVTLN